MARIVVILIGLAVFGCGGQPPTAEPSPERTPWLYPGPQIELLNSSEDMAKIMAAKNLGRMGAKAAEAIPELEKLVGDDNPKVDTAVRAALEQIRAAVGGETSEN